MAPVEDLRYRRRAHGLNGQTVGRCGFTAEARALHISGDRRAGPAETAGERYGAPARRFGLPGAPQALIAVALRAQGPGDDMRIEPTQVAQVGQAAAASLLLPRRRSANAMGTRAPVAGRAPSARGRS